ncbi:MAG TPA: response regulator transcription factor [Steroidobacteraceae bacterium]|nr:response regulator transcription factor [Steroidobacteraceae bacterium]
MTLRIALADDQALVREGLKSLLTSLGIDIAFEAEDGAALLDVLRQNEVDLVVADVRMPGVDGIEFTRQLRAIGDRTPVVLLTTFHDQPLLLAAVDAGANGFLLKDASPQDLLAVMERAHAGQECLMPVATDPLRARFFYADDFPANRSFNERELNILRLMAGGYSNREIAASLFLAEGTIKNYVSGILAKLDTTDRTRAVLKAITLRVI